jgi:hypothetical protein
MKALFALVFLAPVGAFAASPFDGTWKTDLSTLKQDRKPQVYVVNDGMYTCKSCKPEVKVKADGTDQPVKGHDYFDTTAVTIVDANNVKVVDKLGGKPAATMTYAVSADGTTMTQTYNSVQGAQPVAASMTSTRVGKPPKSGNALSGSWKGSAPPQVSESGLTMTLVGTDGGLQMKANGQIYDAKFDGKQVPIMNDPGKTMASLKQNSANVVTETDYRAGKKVDVTKMTVSADGKSMAVEDNDLVTGTKSTYTMVKQP